MFGHQEDAYSALQDSEGSEFNYVKPIRARLKTVYTVTSPAVLSIHDTQLAMHCTPVEVDNVLTWFAEQFYCPQLPRLSTCQPPVCMAQTESLQVQLGIPKPISRDSVCARWWWTVNNLMTHHECRYKGTQ